MLKQSLSMIALVLFAGCSSKEAADHTSSGPQTVTLTPAPESNAPMTLSAADIDGFEKGLKREIEIVKEGKIRASKAMTSVERGNAIQSTFEENTMKEAVPASGLSFERYHLVRGTLSKLLTTLDFQGKIDGPQSVDTTLADSSMKARLASDPYSVLDAASAQLLKSRLNEIVPAWVEYVNLTVVGG